MINREQPGIYDLDAYDYDLPDSLIAQTPAVPRDSARLMVWRVLSGVEHRVFSDIVDYLKPGDLLVLNDTRVLPARLHGTRLTGSGKRGKAEILLLSPESGDFSLWRALVRPRRSLRTGAEVEAGGRVLEIIGEEDDGVQVVKVTGKTCFLFWTSTEPCLCRRT
jgi:S-adenosylmethionine:tRNA ribosyltransferase-isomerase